MWWTKSLVLVLVFPSLLQAITVPKFLQFDYQCGPTVPNLPTQFVTSCTKVGIASATCNTASNNFVDAFTNVDPTTVKRSDYNKYFNGLPVTAKKDQSVFWSGTFYIIGELSKNTYGVTVVTSANSDASKIINAMGDAIGAIPFWCGKKGGGIDYTTKNCDCTPVNMFWDEFSARFAQAANGNSFFLTNGERPDGNGAYYSGSVFGRIEIPNMNPSILKQIIVLDVHRGGYGESCDKPRTDSLVLLKNTLAGKNIAYKCYDVLGNPNSRYDDKLNAENSAKIIKQYQTQAEMTLEQLKDYYSFMLRNGIAE